MTYPAYPPQQPQQPQYPPQQPAYPPQQPQYAPQQPSYPPQQQPAYYPPPQQQQYAPPPPPRGSIDSFYDQPANSGKSISSWFQTPGQSLTGTVARELTDADTQLQTDMQTKQPLPPRPDGSRRWTMTVPLLVTPSPDFPEGRAAWIVSSTDRSDLDAAMQAAGCPSKTVPEAGAVITITFMGYRQIPGFGAPKKVKQISYQRPANASGNGNGQAAPAVAPQPPPPADQPPWQPQQQSFAPGTFQQPNNMYPVTGAQAAQDVVTGPGQYPLPGYQGMPYVNTAPPGQPLPPPPQPQYQQQPPPGYGMAPTQTAPQPDPGVSPSNGQQYAVPAELTPEQAERLRQLTGGQ